MISESDLMNAYTGQILVVDLSKGETKSIETNRKISADFLGGSGFASRFLYDHLDATVNPLSPENMLLFMTGPLAGTLAPCTGRHVVCGKSPLTNLWGESHVGGHLMVS